MIDTIRNRIRRRARYSRNEIFRRVRSMADWWIKEKRIYADGGYASGYMLTHTRKKLRLFGADDIIYDVECSLPRMLFQENSYLISSQDRIEAALREMESVISHMAIPPENEGPPAYEFSRLDLVTQVRIPDVPASRFLQTFAGMSHPRCRTEDSVYRRRGSSIYAAFDARHLRISGYDKELERTEAPGDVVRLEMRLKGGVLKRVLGPSPSEYPTTLNFDECYRAYRDIMLEFPAVKFSSPPRDRGIRSFLLRVLQWAAGQGWKMPDGRSLIDCLADYVERQTHRKYVRDVAVSQFQELGIQWPDLFPPTWPPPHLAISFDQQLADDHGVRVTRMPNPGPWDHDT